QIEEPFFFGIIVPEYKDIKGWTGSGYKLIIGTPRSPAAYNGPALVFQLSLDEMNKFYDELSAETDKAYEQAKLAYPP
ncbi:MAG: hypothetical protein ACRCT6_10895, partial [Notoacmeibacter sp.]